MDIWQGLDILSPKGHLARSKDTLDHFALRLGHGTGIRRGKPKDVVKHPTRDITPNHQGLSSVKAKNLALTKV